MRRTYDEKNGRHRPTGPWNIPGEPPNKFIDQLLKDNSKPSYLYLDFTKDG